ETTRSGSTSSPLDIAYTGGIWDESTGLYYLNSRYYHPAEARFMTRDSAKNGGDLRATLSLYGYCEGDPINGVDPTGRWTSAIHLSKTYEWCRQKDIGLNSRDADALANSDVQVDSNSATQPVSLRDSNLRWHFNRSKNWGHTDSRLDLFRSQRVEALRLSRNRKGAYRKDSMGAFGKGLHPLQDTFAHVDWAVGSKVVPPHHSFRDIKRLSGNLKDFDDPSYCLTRITSLIYISKYVGNWKSQRYLNVEKTTKSELKSFVKLVGK
ncbi:MAG: RHS repeat-associated core domain-containing protein, partial [Coriobacteriia bacterium]|nr:RHS repeat-associated core domain-containing protein [Coriobacteriia bacterium]MCL2536908.1 RHS repeat-associated core domain-containing protein [Coriobacteriia bacterium]